MEHEDLKPCPFCGGRAALFQIEDEPNRGGWCVECSSCRASSLVAFSRKDDARPRVIESWNRRSDATARRAGAIEALEALPCKYIIFPGEKSCLELYTDGARCPRCRALAALKGDAK